MMLELQKLIDLYKEKGQKTLVYTVGGVAFLTVYSVSSILLHLPLISNALVLVGFGYSVWFIKRYLVSYYNREELMELFQEIKDDILGYVDDYTIEPPVESRNETKFDTSEQHES